MINADKILDKVRKVKESRYALFIYIITIILTSIWTLFDLCLANIALPILAVLIPLKLFKENNLKKIAIAGIIAIIIVLVLTSFYQVGFFYGQTVTEVESSNLVEGKVNNIYGPPETEFNFTVKLRDEQQTNVSTVYLNLTHVSWGTNEGEEVEESFEMKRLSDGKTYYYELNLEEKSYLHHFALKRETQEDTEWEETEKAFGPLTISFSNTFKNFIVRVVPLPIMVFLVILSLIWLKKSLDKSKEKSTEGLDEKEKELEEVCPNCGALLKGNENCPECGIKVDDQYEIEKMMNK